MELRYTIISVLERLTQYQFKTLLFLIQDDINISNDDINVLDRVDLASKIMNKYNDYRAIYFLYKVILRIHNTEYISGTLQRSIQNITPTISSSYTYCDNSKRRRHRFRDTEILKAMGSKMRRKLF